MDTPNLTLVPPAPAPDTDYESLDLAIGILAMLDEHNWGLSFDHDDGTCRVRLTAQATNTPQPQRCGVFLVVAACASATNVRHVPHQMSTSPRSRSTAVVGVKVSFGVLSPRERERAVDLLATAVGASGLPDSVVSDDDVAAVGDTDLAA